MINQPVATIFAGVNGTGKTSFYYNTQFDTQKQIEFGYRIDIDEIARSIGNWKDKEIQIKASKKAIEIRNAYIKNQKNFMQETTLCGKSILKLFDELKERGFVIKLYFFNVDSPKTAKERVKIRVAKGGHDIESSVINRRYYESMQNLLKVIPLCYEILFYDNTYDFKLIAKITNNIMQKYKNVVWFDSLIQENII